MLEKKLPREIEDFLKAGNIEELKNVFSKCDPNAVTYNNGYNIFSMMPMPREFAFWAKEQGADINFKDCYGRTPIFEIVRRDGDVKLLIELGADIEAADEDGDTPLHVAAARGKKKAARTLLKAGAKVDAESKDIGGYGHFTPLETVLYKPDSNCTKKYDICKLLLDHGARMTERSRRFVSAFSETFHRHILGKKDSKYLKNQAMALENLCKLFDVEMLLESSFHDGVSPIIVTNVGGGGFENNFWELFDFIVPPRGRAQTAQGEVIRIAGRVRHELLCNGGMNWDEDYRKMLHTFGEYFRLTNPSGEPNKYIEEIIDALKDGDVNDLMIWRICYNAFYWVVNNPEVRPLLECDYTR